jgi:pimeloyl-ACP methyl ester carboxylesterase
VLPRIVRYLLAPNQANRDQLIDWFIGDDPEIHAAFYQQMWWGLQGRPKVAIPILFPAFKLKRITAPTLLLLGENDAAIPAATAQRRVEKHIPQAKTNIISGVTHMINYQAAPIFERVVLDFMGRPVSLPPLSN